MSGETQLSGPDLAQGISLTELPEGGQLVGHAGGEPVLVVRRGEEIFAIGANCTHYGGPLAEGLVVGDTVRCPWHHACFSLRTGEAVAAPALNPVSCFRVERDGDRVIVRETAEPPPKPQAEGPDPVVIVGAGASGNCVAEMLRREGYQGRIVILAPEGEPPYDRPNLSKDYLAGNAPEEWIPLHPREFYDEHHIELRQAEATGIDPKTQTVTLSDGQTLSYGALVLATGAEPIRLAIPGADLPHVHLLRSLADSRALIEAASAELASGAMARAHSAILWFVTARTSACRKGDRDEEMDAVPALYPHPGARLCRPCIGRAGFECSRALLCRSAVPGLARGGRAYLDGQAGASAKFLRPGLLHLNSKTGVLAPLL